MLSAGGRQAFSSQYHERARSRVSRCGACPAASIASHASRKPLCSAVTASSSRRKGSPDGWVEAVWGWRRRWRGALPPRSPRMGHVSSRTRCGWCGLAPPGSRLGCRNTKWPTCSLALRSLLLRGCASPPRLGAAPPDGALLPPPGGLMLHLLLPSSSRTWRATSSSLTRSASAHSRRERSSSRRSSSSRMRGRFGSSPPP
mmetsp:Transcript_47108/g.151558  ORF Transcript_47108/g.151558 Transcript_47108/m.151558 type:complete len:201 (-) Transcript_47108:68-670(-)